jgi:hypothetical protein
MKPAGNPLGINKHVVQSGDGREGRKVVETVKQTWIALRPSAPAAVCVPSFAVVSPAAQAHVLGQPAVAIRVRTWPIAQAAMSVGTTSTSNYMGTTAMSVMADREFASATLQKALVHLATGGNARGIPPRGRPV